MTDDIAEIARGLTPARQGVVLRLDGMWQPGPFLGSQTIEHLPTLRELDLVEREFADDGPPQASIGNHEMTVRMSACWHFRLTPLGIQVQDYLKEMNDDR